MPFAKDINVPLSERLAGLIRQAILTGRLVQGAKIPQDDLAEEFGVSRMPIREALVILAYEGLVTLEPRRGAWVAPLSLETVDEAYTMRQWAESKAVLLSVPLLTPDDLGRAQDILAHLESQESHPEEFVEANAHFHHLLRSRCPWPKLATMVDALWNGFPPLTPTFVDHQITDDRREHHALFEAARAYDGVLASRLMEQHIRRSWRSAHAHFQALGWPDVSDSHVGGDAHASR